MLEQAADLQTRQMTENNKFCKTYRPEKQIDTLPLADRQRVDLRNIAKAFQYSKEKKTGLNILISGTSIETGIHTADALAVECGLKVKVFKFSDMDNFAKDIELTDRVSQEKINLIDYAFSRTTEEAHLLLIVDHNGVVDWNDAGNQNDMDINLAVRTTVATFLNNLREYRGLCCLVMHECPKANIPLEFHAHLKLE